MPDISDKDGKVRVSIFGEEYSIRGEGDKEFIMRVADLVDRQMRTIALKSKNKSPARIAVLAALNIAGELLEVKDKSQSDLGDVEDRARNILDMLDNSLTGPDR